MVQPAELDDDQRLIFENTVRGLFEVALGSKLSQPARAELRGIGIDLDKKLLPAYPLTIWRPALELAVRDVYGGVPMEEGFRLLGRAVVLGICETVIGRAMVALGRLVGTKRALARMNHNFRNSDNYTESRMTELGPTSVEFWVNDVVGHPSYYQGIMEAAIELSGAESAKVTIVSSEGRGCVYRLEWTAR